MNFFLIEIQPRIYSKINFCSRLFFLTTILSFSAVAQDLNFNNVDITKLDNHEIIDLVSVAMAKGYSEEEIVRLAKLQGVSEARIQQIRGEMQRSGTSIVDSDTSVRLREKNLEQGDESKVHQQTHSVGTATEIKGQNESEVFGSYLFKNPNLTFSPNQNIPTPNNYILGPGDEMIIDIWGASEMTYKQTISTEGSIKISGIGPIYINGFTIEKARARVINRLTKIYSGLRSNGSGSRHTYADVTLGKLRSIKVNIIGEVEIPGTYTVSSLSTVFNALYAANGPSKNGSMRYIEIYRAGRKVATLDIYKFLMLGDESSNVRLFDQDIINIRNYRNKVNVSGQVKRPGFYELTEGENFGDLLRYAGGFTARAYVDQILITRFTDKQKELVTIRKDEFDSFLLKNGDDLFISEVLDRYTNRLRISGAVFRPGTYRFEPGMTLTDLMEEADGITGDAYLDRGLIVRLMDDMRSEFIDFDLRKVIANDENDLLLKEEDSVVIHSVLNMLERDHVLVTGEVINPGKFLYHENMTLGDILIMAGGFKRSANGSHIDLSRAINNDSLDNKSKISVVEKIPVRDFDIRGADKRIILQPLDLIKINTSSGYEKLKTVSIKGEILFPGKYAIQNRKDRVSDLITRSGGLKETAFIDGALLIRPTMRNDENFSVAQDQNLELINKRFEQLDEQYAPEELISINLQKILDHPEGTDDLILLEGDIVLVPQLQGTVKIVGETLHPAVLPYNPTWKLLDFVESAGGFTQNAKQSKVHVVDYNGKASSTKKLLWINRYPAIRPGSEIVVPGKLPKEKPNLRDLLSVTASTLSLIFIISRI